MNSILNTIVVSRLRQMDADRAVLPDMKLRKMAERPPIVRDFPFEKALDGTSVAVIAEVKKASPSKGLIAADFPYLDIAKRYESAGANAISVLTEPMYFLGANDYLEEISRAVSVPTLRKDFVVDLRMIDEARLLGASAVLLIVAVLGPEKLGDALVRAEELGLSALVETHDEREIDVALSAGTRILGVNNRNLTTFDVDLAVAERLRPRVPNDILFVAESGIHTPDDFERMKNIGADAVLIGEAFMRADNIGETFRTFRNEA